MAFLSLCFFWALLRIIFFSVVVDQNWTSKDNWIFLILYWFPINIQFATFSLLVVFYAHLHHKHKQEWYSFKRKYKIFYTVFNISFLILEGMWIILGIIFDSGANEPTWLTSIHRIFSAVVFFLLVCIVGFYGLKAAKLSSHSHQTKLLARISFPTITFVSISLFLIFTLRGIYDFSTVVSKKLVLNLEGETKFKQFLPIFVFFIFEIVPTILVLILFGKVRTTSLGMLNKSNIQSRKEYDYKYHVQSSTPESNSYQSPQNANTNTTPSPHSQLTKAEIFNDPKRYDSDDENTPFDLTKQSPNGSYNSMNFGSMNYSAYSTQSQSQINGDLTT